MDEPDVLNRFRETSEAIRRLWFNDLMTIAGFCDYENLQDLSWGLGHAQTTVGDEMALRIHTDNILPALRTLESAEHDMLRFRNNLYLIFPVAPPADNVRLGRKCYTLRCAAPLTLILWSLALGPDDWRHMSIHAFDAILEMMGQLAFNGVVPDNLMRAACEVVHRGREEYGSTDFFGFLEAWEVAHRWDRRLLATGVRFDDWNIAATG